MIMNNESQRKIILIGGAPATGKSTMAGLIAKRLGIQWISTDQIREMMRVTARREDMPKLFSPEGYTAEKFLTEFSAEEIVRMEMGQGEAVWVVIKQIIEDDYTWKGSFVVEGISILPYLIKKDFGDDKNIKAVFLINEDAEEVRHIVFTRGLWDETRTYSDDVKEKEVEWSLLFGHKIKAEAEKHGYPWIEMTNNQDDIENVINALKL
jgi:2-phosphoglycerate kinase